MTSRCRFSGQTSYATKTRAEKAITKNVQLAGGRAYKCHCSSWHVEGSLRGGADVRQDQPVRWGSVEWDEATMLLWSRCRDLCEWCGKALAGNMERHHRQVREVGGDRLANLIALHTGCHVPGVHAVPDLAMARGAIVSRHTSDPAAVPLTLPDGREVFLDDEGRYLAA